MSPFTRITAEWKKTTIYAPRRQLFWLPQPWPGKSRQPGNFPGNGFAAHPISLAIPRIISGKCSPREIPRDIAGGLHMRNHGKFPERAPGGWTHPPYRAQARFRRPFPLYFPAVGPDIPTPVRFQNIRRPAGRRGFQTESSIWIPIIWISQRRRETAGAPTSEPIFLIGTPI